MKKNISINIGGIIFHIEEDGYERLRSYLDSINKYFSAFEDSKEIVDDIENRIAEILLAKLTDGKQVVNKEDIDDLISTMGTVADFEATIEVEDSDLTQEAKEEKKEEKAEEEQEKKKKEEGPKKLYRNTQRRVLGGVASGMAHYFNIDPIWIRLLILALFFNIFFWGLSGATLLAYIILWIVLPGNDQLEEDKKVKKLYRDSDDRVLGGVASGIAAYFGTDKTVIRLLFVISIFLGGAGILLYIILWIITPEARSITEKMQMQGEPVTLSNIEENVKKSFNVKEGEENVFVKILLFPFRLIALVINGLAEILGPLLKFLVEAIRILFGVVVILLGFSLMFSFVVTMAFFLGIGTGWTNFIYLDDPTFSLLFNAVDPLGAIGFFLLTFIPALALTLLGVVIIVRRKVGNAYVGWSLFGLWVIGLIISAFYIPSLAKDFRSDTDIREEVIFEKTGNIPTLKLNEEVEYDDYDGINLKLRGHSDSTYKLVMRIESRGYDRNDAQENAEMIDYRVRQSGDDFIFDSDIQFNNAPFRFQEVHAIFYIPFGQVFRMDRELSEILRSTLHLNGYRTYQMEGNDWVFDQSGINCLTCDEERDRRDSYIDDDRDRDRDINWDRVSGEKTVYAFEDFDEITVTSLIDIRIIQDDEYKVEIVGDEEDIEELTLNQRGNELEIEYRNEWDWFDRKYDRDNKITAFVHLPELRSVELIGGCKGEISGFDEGEIEINLTGASDLVADISPEAIDVNLTGASTLRLNGRAEKLDAKVIGASRISAFEFYAKEVVLEVLGASKAYVYAADEMEIDAAGASTVRYRGTDRVNVESVGFSSVKRD